jgi:hypothetical protein
MSFAGLTGAATSMDERLLFRPPLSFGDEIFVRRQRPLMTGCTQWHVRRIAAAIENFRFC